MRAAPTTTLLVLSTLLLAAWPAAGLPLLPAPGITDFATGDGNTCVVEAGKVRCFDGAGRAVYRDDLGTATGVASSISNVCVLRVTGTVDCHGFFGEGDGYVGVDPAVKVALGAFHGCVLTRLKNVHCWGNDAQGEAIHHLGGDVADVAVGGWHTCLRFESGAVRCAGDQEDQMFNYTGTDTLQVAAGASHTCILFESREVRCRGWGHWDGETVVDASGTAAAISAGEWGVTCVRHLSGTVACTGNARDGGGSYDLPNAIDAKTGWGHSCALTGAAGVGTRLVCWGTGAPAAYPL